MGGMKFTGAVYMPSAFFADIRAVPSYIVPVPVAPLPLAALGTGKRTLTRPVGRAREQLVLPVL